MKGIGPVFCQRQPRDITGICDWGPFFSTPGRKRGVMGVK